MNSLENEIRARLAALDPVVIDLRDDSAKHAGHAGSAGGGGHYHLHVVAACFAGQTRVARHRAVYDKLADLIPLRIHALAIDARTPAETGGERIALPPEETP